MKIDPQFIGSENNPSARVTIEQQISNDVTFTYATSLTQSAETVIQVEYNIDKNVFDCRGTGPEWRAGF